jgi:phage terminase large subunit-like protein
MKIKDFLGRLNEDELLYLYREKVGARCKRDLYFLCKYILDFKDMTQDFHKPLCLAIQDVNKYLFSDTPVPTHIRNKLWLIFRGSFKTSVITIGHTIQLLLNYPNIRILLASNKLDNAKEILGVIKAQFMYNPKFRLLFPEYCPVASSEGKVEWGTSTSVTLPNRTKLTLKEGSIECAGVDTGLTSRHYDYMKKDDLVTEKSVTTDEQIQAAIDWDRLSLSLFEVPEKGFTDWIGTRYDYRDLYGHLLKRPKTELTRYICPAVVEGRSVFPQRFSPSGLDQIKKDQGSVIYSCQYDLNPISEEDQEFKEDWIKKCVYLDPPREYAIIINVDPATSRSKQSKFTAMLVHAIDKEGRWNLVDGVFDKLSAPQRVAALFGLAKKWKNNLRLVSYETIGFQETDKVMIEQLMREKKFFFHIEPVDARSVSKEGRIRGLSPLYEHQRILLPETLPYFSTYENRTIDIVQKIKYELARFPQCEHLDLIDAQSQMLKFPRVRAFSKGTSKGKIVPGSFMYYREKMRKYNHSPMRKMYGIDEVWDKIKVG